MEYFCICFGRFPASFFRLFLFNLPHIEHQHLKIHLLVVAPQRPDQPAYNVGEHGAAHTVLEVEQGVFVVARPHIGYGGVKLLPQMGSCNTAVGAAGGFRQ